MLQNSDLTYFHQDLPQEPQISQKSPQNRALTLNPTGCFLGFDDKPYEEKLPIWQKIWDDLQD